MALRIARHLWREYCFAVIEEDELPGDEAEHLRKTGDEAQALELHERRDRGVVEKMRKVTGQLLTVDEISRVRWGTYGDRIELTHTFGPGGVVEFRWAEEVPRMRHRSDLSAKFERGEFTLIDDYEAPRDERARDDREVLC